jgi:hypothetical protein
LTCSFSPAIPRASRGRLSAPTRLDRQNKLKVSALGAHAAIHFGTACATINLGLDLPIAGTVLLLSFVHAVLDYAKARLSTESWVAFTVDQALHLLAVGLASLWLATGSWNGAAQWLAAARQNEELFLYLSAYVGVVSEAASSCRRSRIPSSRR